MTVRILLFQNRFLDYFLLKISPSTQKKMIKLHATTRSVLPSNVFSFRTQLVFRGIVMLKYVAIKIFGKASLDNIESETAVEITTFTLENVLNM